MKIAEASQKFGMSIQTLRYYEREGIIPPVHRNKNGIRDYQRADLYWLHYVQALRRAGISVASIKKYVQLVQEGKETREKRKQILLEQRTKLIKKIEQEQDALRHLNYKLSVYDQYVIDLENNTKK